MSEDPLKECPQCGAPAERLLSAGGGLLFKGSGFYITDYRSDSYRKAAEADSPRPKEAGGGKDASSGTSSPSTSSATPPSSSTTPSSGKKAE